MNRKQAKWLSVYIGGILLLVAYVIAIVTLPDPYMLIVMEAPFVLMILGAFGLLGYSIYDWNR